MLKAGVAKIDVTPPVGLRMSGFAGRVFPSLAVHDPLWARVIVFDDSERRAGLVTMDLLGVSEFSEGAKDTCGAEEESRIGTHEGQDSSCSLTKDAARNLWTGFLNILAIKLERHGSSHFSADEQDGGG
jgi:hypothetical protein